MGLVLLAKASTCLDTPSFECKLVPWQLCQSSGTKSRFM